MNLIIKELPKVYKGKRVIKCSKCSYTFTYKQGRQRFVNCPYCGFVKFTEEGK